MRNDLASLSVASASRTPLSAAALDRAGSDRLIALQQAPEEAGALIYQGAVFPLSPAQAPQLFSYERRLSTIGGNLSASHITKDGRGDVVVVESAQLTPDYEVQRFDAVHKPAGYSGSVVVTGGRHLEFELRKGGKTSTASEDVKDPVVTGPSLHGFILQHKAVLAAGGRIRVRMIVLAQKQTYGFEIRRTDAPEGHIAFSIAPTNLLVRLALAPLRVVFDAAGGNVVRYVGRVPPMREVNGRMKAFDARVEYTMNVAVYR